MTTDAFWPLKKAILAALKEDKELAALLDGSDAIRQERLPGAQLSVCFGNCTTRVWHSATFDGQAHEITIEIYGARDGSASVISSRIIALLHDADFPIPGHALIELEFISSETRKACQDGTEHGRLLFHGLTVSD